MKRTILYSMLIVMLVAMPSISMGKPTVQITSPDEDDIINDYIVTVTGTAEPSSGDIIMDTASQFETGANDNTSVTDAGEVILFPGGPWQKGNGGNPVLDIGAPASFDDESIGGPCIIEDGGSFTMWYQGNDGNNARIGVATSPDAITWTRGNGGSAVLGLGAVDDFDSFSVMDPFVIKDGSTYKMWFTGNNGIQNEIGYATSSDGVVWAKDSGNPVLELGAWGKFDEESVYAPAVIKIGGTYHMWYTGSDGSVSKIGYATSSDGTNWNRQNNGDAVFSPSGSGGFDSNLVSHPSVIEINGIYRMYYQGSNGLLKRIGAAKSPDGITWERLNDGKPIINLGPTDNFDDAHVFSPGVVRVGLVEHMVYTGNDGDLGRIGYAEATITQIAGLYMSPPFDQGGAVEYGTITFMTDVPAGTTLQLETRTGSSQSNWGTWETPTSNSDLPNPDNRWFQFKVTMTSNDLTTTPRFQFLSLHYEKPLERVEVSPDGVLWLRADGTTSWTIDLDLEDGHRLIQVRAVDITGEHSELQYLNITVNSDAPTGSVVINDGDQYTKSRSVNLNLSAEDSIGVASMIISEDPAFSGAVWEPFAWNKLYELSEGDGFKIVNVKFRDNYGQESEIYNDSISLDTTPPVCTVEINDGDDYTSSTEIILKISASDTNGIAGMMISTDPTFQGTSLQTYYESEFFDISKGDGLKTIYLRVQDNAGVTGDCSDSITLDTTPPKGTVKINNNAATTITETVNLTLSASDKNGVAEMMISNKDTFNGTEWEPFRSSKIWNLSEGEGERFVFVKFKDLAGIEGEVATDSISRYVLSDNGTVVIDDGAEFTDNRNVTVTFVLGDLAVVSDMMVTETGSFDGCEWEIYTEKINRELLPGDGVKTVMVMFRDPYGIVTGPFSDEIVLDTKPPNVKFMEPSNGTVTREPLIDLWGRVDDENGIAKVEISVDAGPWEEANINASDPTRWDYQITLLGYGPHDITVLATDLAGNTAEAYLALELKKKKSGNGPMLGPAFIILAIAIAVIAVTGRRKK